MTRTSIAAVVLLFALAAQAHTRLKASRPAADAAGPAPQALELEFGGDVRLTSVTLTDAAGHEHHLDDLPTAIGSTFSLAIHEALAPGRYTVLWRAVGGDTHIVSGELAFTVTAP